MEIFKKIIGMMLLAGVFMTTGVTASPAEKSTGVFPYTYQNRSLPNGLKVILIPLDNPGLVAYYSIVRTGSRDEWEPGHSGFAHFFEHMMFRGTKKYPGAVYDRLMTEMGANANAYTTDDLTAYHLVFSKENLAKVIELESDRFQNLFYEEREFKTESGAVMGEYLKSLASPYSVLEEKLMDTAFDVHTYKHTTIGFRADIEAMPTMYEYSKSFFQRYYRPENVVLLITGDFEPDSTFKMIESNYGGWQPGYITPQIKPEPEQKGERTADVTYQGRTLPILTIAYKGPALSVASKDAAACYLLSSLAFGQNSELYKKLVIQEQRVQFIAPSFSFNRDPNLIGIFAMIKDEKDINGVRDDVYRTIEQFQITPVDAVRLQAEKDNLKYSFLMDLDTAEKVAGGLARFVAVTGGIEVVDQLYALFESLTPGDIQTAAQKYLVLQHRTMIVLMGGKS